MFICLNVFSKIFHQTQWPKHIPCASTGGQRKPFVLSSMELLFPSFTGYKARATKDLSQLKMLEFPQIQTQELMLPHKIAKVCTVHIVLWLLGPLSLFRADTFRNSAAQISTGTMPFSTNIGSNLAFCSCICVTFWNVKALFSGVLVTPFYCPVIYMTYRCLF